MMPKYIIKMNDKYLIWSTIVDAPVTWGMDLEGLKEYTRREYGESGLRDLPYRLERVAKHGTSSMDGTSVEDITAYNRAGADETHLTVEEIYKWYCVKRTNPPRGVGKETDPQDWQ